MSLERRRASTNEIGTARVRHEHVRICVLLTGVSNSDLLRYSFHMVDRLPIEDSLQQLTDALASHRQAVLRAPTGAGKTTRVPLALLEAGLTQGRIVMLEPRRLATRAAARTMAISLSEKVGQTVGYRIRGETRVSKATRIEVVTEGVLTRMIQADPDLKGIGALIFDEFHERSLNTDLGLALALECRAALREDLLLLVMSATIDAAPVAALMGDAPVITSEGRSYPVDTRWIGRPRSGPVEAGMVSLIKAAATETRGGMLAFLPGEREIRSVIAALDLPEITILPLYGSLPFAEQNRALGPTDRRKLVLATSIAETSLTIPDVSVVIDCGYTRRSRFDPGSGMSRLVTERVARAEAEQRRGRAGRVADGICYRLWTKGEEGALAPFPPPEIETADLAGLALELAEWGACELSFLSPPPEGSLSDARALLAELGAMEGTRITDHGRVLVRLPLHPRLGHMLALAGKSAAPLAALLSDRDPLRTAGADLSIRLDALASRHRDPVLDRIRAEASRLSRVAPDTRISDPSAQAALAYPDRIALRRKGRLPRWLLSGGKGAKMDAGDPLAGSPLLVVTGTDGHPTEATVRTALPVSEGTLRDVLGDRVTWNHAVRWSSSSGRVVAVEEERLGAIALSSRRWKDVPPAELSRAMLDGIRHLGLSLSPAARQFQARVAALRAAGHDMPDMADETLLDTLGDWLLPHLGDVRTASGWKAFDVLPCLRGMLDWQQVQVLDREAPPKYETPLGRKVMIDYTAPEPEVSLRVQELFGTRHHPSVAGKPLCVTLLSPADRPVQTTMDLPGFWASSYADVRKEMKGRYPKHHWPKDPVLATPGLNARRRRCPDPS